MNQLTSALLIPIARYERGPNNESADLNGPRNDADDFREALNTKRREQIESEFSGGRLRRKLRRLRKGRDKGAPIAITEIADEKATKAAYLREWAKFISNIKVGELGLIHESRHGSYIEGDDTEADGTCEIACCHDYFYDGWVTDDERRQLIVDHLKTGAELLIITDACHSGDSIRDFSQKARSAPPVQGKRTIVFDDRIPEGVTLFSACAPDEVGWERDYEGKRRGALSWNLLPMIVKMARGEQVDYDAEHRRVSILLDGDNTKGGQTPQLERYA